MQRTLDVILTTANFQSAEKGEEREMRTRYAKSRGMNQNEAVEHPSFPGLRVVWKEESFNRITDGESRGRVALNKGRNARECDVLSQRGQMDGWVDRLTTRCGSLLCTKKQSVENKRKR